MTLDTALQEREASRRPIRVGMVGAGATGRAIALQLATPVPGIRLVAIANRTPSMASGPSKRPESRSGSAVESVREAESAIDRGIPVLIDDPLVLAACRADRSNRGGDRYDRGRRPPGAGCVPAW